MGESAKKSDLFHFEDNTRLVKILKIGGEEALLLLVQGPSPIADFSLLRSQPAQSTEGASSIKGEINLPLDWLTVQKAKLTWQSELDDSLSSQQSYSVQGKVDNKVNCTRPQLTEHSCCDKVGQKPGGSRPTLVLKYTNFHHLLIHIINDLPFNTD